jgi:hypothetical protein
MCRVIIFVRGGNVQGMVAEKPGIQVMVVDYDNEEEDRTVVRTFEEATHDPEYFRCAVEGTE